MNSWESIYIRNMEYLSLAVCQQDFLFVQKEECTNLNEKHSSDYRFFLCLYFVFATIEKRTDVRERELNIYTIRCIS